MKHRLHVQDSQDAARQAPMAVSLQYMDLWVDRESGIKKTSYFDADPEFANVLEISSWNQIKNEPYHWDQQNSAIDGCTDLVNPTLARPLCSLEDPACPTLLLLDRLRQLKWIPCTCEVEHTSVNDKHFDCRSPNSKTKYYQVLLSLEERLVVNPCIISSQPQSYFSLVL
jgi:hypothetical protein